MDVIHSRVRLTQYVDSDRADLTDLLSDAAVMKLTAISFERLSAWHLKILAHVHARHLFSRF